MIWKLIRCIDGGEQILRRMGVSAHFQRRQANAFSAIQDVTGLDGDAPGRVWNGVCRRRCRRAKQNSPNHHRACEQIANATKTGTVSLARRQPQLL